MPSYDRSHTPPAPVATVVLVNPFTGEASQPTRAKLDTGADFTVVPELAILQLGLIHKSHIRARGYEGPYSRRPLYYIDLRLEGFDVPLVQCIASDRSDVLVGRNVLNQFILTLNGKNLSFDLVDP